MVIMCVMRERLVGVLTVCRGAVTQIMVFARRRLAKIQPIVMTVSAVTLAAMVVVLKVPRLARVIVLVPATDLVAVAGLVVPAIPVP